VEFSHLPAARRSGRRVCSIPVASRSRKGTEAPLPTGRQSAAAAVLISHRPAGKLKEVLGIAVEATAQPRRGPRHVAALTGPGLGKPWALGDRRGVGVRCGITVRRPWSAPRHRRPAGQPAAHELLFIDEITAQPGWRGAAHPAMEDYRLISPLGRGSTARTRSVPVAPFPWWEPPPGPGAFSSPLT